MANGRREGHLDVHAGPDGAQRDILLPVLQVIRVEEVAGGPLFVAAAAALLWVNLAPVAYTDFWAQGLTLSVAGGHWQVTLHQVVNDGLLPLFFFVAGLELKRELVRGELSSLTVAALPLVMALGGMAVPALVYLSVAWGTDAAPGWGVPVATDIAFALGLVALLGKRVPGQVRVALLAFAALDDVGGVIVIAATHYAGLSWMWLGAGALLIAACFGLQRITLLPGLVSVLTALAAFGAVMASGLHPTLAGIALGLTVPAMPMMGRGRYLAQVDELSDALREMRERRRRADDPEAASLRAEEDAVLGRLEALTIGTESVLDRLARNLNPWASYLVLPIFALANGGVVLNLEGFQAALAGSVFWAVMAGLVVGKPLGLVVVTWLAARFGLVRLPDGMGWGHVAALGVIAGIGFTVSLFIAALAFDTPALLSAAKLGILGASLLSAALGAALLLWASRQSHR